MANRRFIQGFEHGTTGRNAASDANITVQSSIKRTGTYALRCNIQAGVSSTLSLGSKVNRSDSDNSFGYYRFYIYIATLPSSTRTIIATTISVLPDFPEVAINSTGHVVIRNNGVDKITTSGTLSTGAWHCLEFGLENQHRLATVKLDNALDFDWTSWSNSAPNNNASITDIVVGALATTGTSAMDYYLDDIAFDDFDWCGSGSVVGLKANNFSDSDGDNAAWTNVGGATKMLSIAWPSDDDTTYIQSSTTSGTTTALLFDIDDAPNGTSLVKGSTVWARVKRTTSNTGNTIVVRRKLYGIYENFNNEFWGATNTYANYNISTNSWSPLGWELTLNDFNAIDWGVYNGDAASYRLTAFMIEADCSSDPQATLDPKRIFMASCDTGDTSEFIGGNTGSPAASQVQVRNGNYSIVTTAAANSSTALTVTSISYPFYPTPLNVIYGKAHIYISSLPTTGSVEIIKLGSTFSRSFGIQLTSTGTLGINNWGNPTTQATTSTATISTGAWHRLEWYVVNEGTSPTSNGKMTINLDGVTIATNSTMHSASPAGWTSSTFYWGVIANGSSTGSTTIYWDDVVIDYAMPIGNTSISTLRPTAVGKYAGSGWTVNTGTAYGAVSETTANDGDTTYIKSGASNVTFPESVNAISFVLNDLPGSASIVKAMTTVCWIKMDLGSGIESPFSSYIVSGNDSLRVDGSISANADTTYKIHPHLYPVGPNGQFTTAQINSMELLNWNAFNSAYRVTQQFATVEYAPVVTDALNVVLNGKVAVANTHEVVCNGFVDPGVTVRTKEVVQNGKVAATNTYQVIQNGKVAAAGTRNVTLNAMVQATNTHDVTQNGKVQSTGVRDVVQNALVISIDLRQVVLNAMVQSVDTKDVVLRTMVQGTTTKQVVLPGMVQKTTAYQVLLPAMVQQTNVYQTALHAIVQQTNLKETILHGTVKATETFEVGLHGSVQAAGQHTVDLHGMVQKTSLYEVAANGYAIIIDTRDVVLHGMLRDTKQKEVLLRAMAQTTTTHDAALHGMVLITEQRDVALHAAVQTSINRQVGLNAVLQQMNSYGVGLHAIVQATDLREVVLQADLLAHETFEVAQRGVVTELNIPFDVDVHGYVGGVIGNIHAEKYASRRINAIPFIMGARPGGYINYNFPHSQIRVAQQGESKRVSLLDLNLDGYIVNGLSPDSHVSFTVYHQDKSQWLETQNAIWTFVYFDEKLGNVYGWTALIDMPPRDETITIVWNIDLDGVIETILDYIEVKT